MKIGDRVIVKTKYFSPYDSLEGEIKSVDKWDEKRFVVQLDSHENSSFIFDKNELKIIK